jgi:predicted component of type VI protein secretion system
MLRITLLRRGAPEHVVDLGNGTLRIGRSASNELLLRDPDKTVSRTHARIVRSGDGWTFIDQDSLNGSWMSGELVERIRLAPGMTITLGDYELRCEARDLRSARPEEQTRIAGIPGLAHARDEAHAGHDTETRGTAVTGVDQHLVAHFADAAGSSTEIIGGDAVPGDGSEPTGTGR